MGDPADQATGALLAEVHQSYLPNRLLVGKGAETIGPSDESESTIPLLQEKKPHRRAPDGVRMPELRLQPAGHRASSPGRPACGVIRRCSDRPSGG